MKKPYLLWDVKQEAFQILEEDDYQTSYRMISDLIDGYLKSYTLNRFPDIDIWFDRDGDSKDLQQALIIFEGNSENETVKVLKGNLVFARHNERGQLVPLNSKEINRLLKQFERKLLLPYNGKLIEAIYAHN